MKSIYKILGFVSLGLAILGAALPVLPTTPFLLLSLWLFSRSSPRWKRWLLTNRMFGQYLDDYRSGRGIPLRVKIYVLLLLWGVILYSVIAVVDPVWLKITLLLIAAGVTVHLSMVRTKRWSPRIVILAATESEIAPFRRRWTADGRDRNIRIEICGMGMAATAGAVTRVLHRRQPDLIVLAGIAGAYPDSGLSTGDCVLVASERTGDLGAFRAAGFEAFGSRAIPCPWARAFTGFPFADGYTVNVCAAPFSRHLNRVPTDAAGAMDANAASFPAIENMEGAAFFAVAKAAGIPFVELRAVSNRVGDEPAVWNVPLAAERLTESLSELIAQARSLESLRKKRRK